MKIAYVQIILIANFQCSITNYVGTTNVTIDRLKDKHVENKAIN